MQILSCRVQTLVLWSCELNLSVLKYKQPQSVIDDARLSPLYSMVHAHVLLFHFLISLSAPEPSLIPVLWNNILEQVYLINEIEKNNFLAYSEY